jgi:hypothetical protein
MSRTFIFRYRECRHDSAAQRYPFDKEITEDTTIICRMRNFCSDCMSRDPPPGGGAFNDPTPEEARRAQDIWHRLAQNPGFIDPLEILKGFQLRDYRFTIYIMSLLENDLHYRWANRQAPQPTFEERQLVLQIRHVVQQMLIERTMRQEELPNGGSGEWSTSLDEPQKLLLTDVPLEELQEDEKDCVICAETFGVANEYGRIAMPCRTPCQHLFCRRCLLLHIRKRSARTSEDHSAHDDSDEPDQTENSDSWSYSSDSNNADDDVRSESGDSEHSGRSNDSRYSQYSFTSDYISSAGWPRCPLCNQELNMEEYLGPSHEVEDPDHECPPWMQIFRPSEWRGYGS